MADSELGKLEKIDLLLEASRAHRYDNPREMLYLAELALQAALRLKETEIEWRRIADIRSRTWAELGNAYRLTDHLDRAEQAFHSAVAHFEAGTGDPFLLATIIDRFATLLCHRRRFSDAIALLDRLYQVHLASGNRSMAARTLITRGLYTENQGQPAQAVLITCQALELLDELGSDPELVLAALHNLLWCATELGRFPLVETILRDQKFRVLYKGNRLNLLRLRWIEARVDAGMGRENQAEAAFREVRSEFLAAGLLFPASLVFLEFALLLLRQSRLTEVRDIAEELISAFTALRVGREALLALMLLSQTCENGKAKIAEIRRLIETAFRLVRDLAS